jgi:hypothetical protein
MQQITNIQELLQAKADQINNKSHAQVYGKAAEYKRLLSHCKFKLVVWFARNKFGQLYTVYDKQHNKNINRQYIPSLDTIITGGMQVTDHEIAHSTLINYCFQNIDNIDKAMMILIDYVNNQELTIFKFNPQNVISSQYVHPIFKRDDFGNNFCVGLQQKALRIDELRIIE